jgi:hypothetical protein
VYLKRFEQHANDFNTTSARYNEGIGNFRSSQEWIKLTCTKIIVGDQLKVRASVLQFRAALRQIVARLHKVGARLYKFCAGLLKIDAGMLKVRAALHKT